jgi:hypothetical protein
MLFSSYSTLHEQLTVTSRNFLENLILSSGDIFLLSGDIFLLSGDVFLSSGVIFLSPGNIFLLSGDNFMVIRKDTTIRTLKTFTPSNRGFERSVCPRPGGMTPKDGR